MELAHEKSFLDVDQKYNSEAKAVLQNILPHVPSFQGSFLKTNEYIESHQDMDPSESSGESEDPEEEIVEDFKDGETERDDEDFVAAGSPKPKKKQEKRAARGAKQSASRKRKCEFCGTTETPMWRRGPTGKGTLCNACGVKWSLKFRKRAGKKPKQDKHTKHDDLPREQTRHSTRKKIPAKRLSSTDSKEEHSPQDSSGYCCSHSPHSARKRTIADDYYEQPPTKKRKEHLFGSGDEDSLSDEDDAASNRLLGRLLNVVEVQLVEMRQIELVRRQIAELRSELHSKEQQRLKQIEQQKAETLHELHSFRQEMLTVTAPNAEGSHEKMLDSGSQVILDFIGKIRAQLNDIRSTLGTSVSNGLGKKLDNFQLELDGLQLKMYENFTALKAKAASDAISMQKIISAKEQSIRSGLVSLSKCAEEEFTTMNERLDTMEGSL